jgi:hypothetical protein
MVELTYGAYQKHLRLHRQEQREKEADEEREGEKEGERKKWKKHARMCAVCGKVFRDKTYLDIHVNSVHSSARPFACTWPGCDHTSKTKKDLHDHVAFHGEKKEVCDQCGMKFHRTVELKLHMQDHFGKKFQCSECSRRFKKPFDLKEHVEAVHLGIRRFPCTSCEKKFQSKWALTKHVEAVHLDYRPFQCSQCAYASKTKQALDKHMLKHTKAKPFSCPDCGQTYSCESSFKKHRLAKHKGSQYLCPVCHQGFPIPRSLHFHLRMCHNEVAVGAEDDIAMTTANQITTTAEQFSVNQFPPPNQVSADAVNEFSADAIFGSKGANLSGGREGVEDQLCKEAIGMQTQREAAEQLSRELLMQQNLQHYM